MAEPLQVGHEHSNRPLGVMNPAHQLPEPTTVTLCLKEATVSEEEAMVCTRLRIRETQVYGGCNFDVRASKEIIYATWS